MLAVIRDLKTDSHSCQEIQAIGPENYRISRILLVPFQIVLIESKISSSVTKMRY